MKKLLCLALFFIIAIPVFAQTEDPVSAAFEPLEVSNVRVRLSEADGISLVFNANPAVCEELLVDIEVDGEFLEVHAYAPRSDTVCNFVAPYEPVIQLPELETGQAYVLFLNDFASTFFLTDAGEDSSFEPFPAIWGQDTGLTPFELIPPVINSIEFNGTEITLTGNHTDGCITEEYLHVRQDDVQGNLYHIEPFRLLTPIVMCPDQLIPYEVTLQLDLSEGDIVEIGGTYYQIVGGQAEEVLRHALEVETVEILPTNNGNIVVVGGRYSQDCGFNQNSYVLENEFVSLIEMVSYSSPGLDIACDTDFFEDSFTVDVLPVVINGRAFDENGEISPLANSQSNENPPEGNYMPVNTVIESVEVAILESFPMQLQLTVSGYQPDGCDFPVEVEQSVEGNDVTLHIYRNVPADAMCPMVLNPYEETIMVDGSFEGGTVNIQINDFSTSVDL